MSVELSVVLTACLPISELRGAIPLGIIKGLPFWETYFLAVAGNLVPVIPLLLFLKPVSEKLSRFRLTKRFFLWLYGRTKRRAEMVEKYESIGLAMLVAIPLPITGAWTGCVAASLFKIKFRYALAAITFGVLLAGIIVGILTMSGKHILGVMP